VISYTSEGGFESIEAKSIKEGDVLHIYDKNKAIVRKDAKKRGRFTDLYGYQGFYFAEIDGDDYQVRVTDDKRPVYSMDGRSFSTLYAEDLDYEIDDLIGSDIVYLLDMNGHIQGIIDK
jgi:hypothetical protein